MRGAAIFMGAVLLGGAAYVGGAPRASRADDQAAAAIDSRVATLHAALLDEKREAILYRALEHEGQVWDYPDGPEGAERPFQTIPHHTLDVAARKKLAALLVPEHVKVIAKSDFPGYSYLLELVAKGGAIARVDFHTEGGEAPCAFWMPELGRKAKAEPVEIGFQKGGLKVWRDALDSVWKAAK